MANRRLEGLNAVISRGPPGRAVRRRRSLPAKMRVLRSSLLASSDASFVNGETLFCDNGMLVRA